MTVRLGNYPNIFTHSSKLIKFLLSSLLNNVIGEWFIICKMHAKLIYPLRSFATSYEPVSPYNTLNQYSIPNDYNHYDDEYTVVLKIRAT